MIVIPIPSVMTRSLFMTPSYIIKQAGFPSFLAAPTSILHVVLSTLVDMLIIIPVKHEIYADVPSFLILPITRKFQERKEECDAWRDVLPPKVNAKIIKNSKTNRQLTIISVGDQEYELLGSDETFAVKMREYHCGCGSWQISVIPCPHAMAAISHSCGRQSLKAWVPNFVHQSLTKSAYIQTYRGMIHPLPDQKMWPPIETDELLPPPYETQPGRPKLQRKREDGEKAKGGRSGTVIYKLCGMADHNKRTCKSSKSSGKQKPA
ncbi:hypothetical protein Dsin_018728 [Dipteronia sinensis]|uniref:SWIM-type domain-containing protein n=1 Tax=Dipteronia sinensis TaxID=43782 RepID=A0AAE0A6F8_9ROSI|nr:hypothetical protein Dsin_018728 [Dipteronia sinensis]